MAFLSVTAGVTQAETGNAIGQGYTVDNAGDQLNRETWQIGDNTEVVFPFAPVSTGKAGLLVVRFYGFVDPSTAATDTKITWGYTTGTGTHEHMLHFGETSIVRLNPALARSQIFIFNPENVGTPTDIYVEAQVWEV